MLYSKMSVCTRCKGKIVREKWCFMCAQTYCFGCSMVSLSSACVACPNGFCKSCIEQGIPEHMNEFMHDKRIGCFICHYFMHPLCGIKHENKIYCGKCWKQRSQSVSELPGISPIPKIKSPVVSRSEGDIPKMKQKKDARCFGSKAFV